MKQIYFYLFVKCKLFFFFLISILIPSQLKNLETHLVTGATGLVGMHIVFDLLSQNKKVCATFTKNSNRNIIKNVFNHYGFSNNYDKIVQMTKAYSVCKKSGAEQFNTIAENSNSNQEVNDVLYQ